MSDAAARVAAVRGRIDAAAERAGRDPGEITLIAVSKTHPEEAVREVLDAGVEVFGENRVQEATIKVPRVPEARWHFIGRLQRNKARRALELFELIHALDGERLAQTLARLGAERGAPARALVEVNVGGEESKGGLEPGELVDFVRAASGLDGLEIEGLMTIPPPVEEPEEARGFFRQLAELSREIAALGLPGVTMNHLSMGMSHDFEIAIEEGATLVRVGTALFGERRPWPPAAE